MQHECSSGGAVRGAEMQSETSEHSIFDCEMKAAESVAHTPHSEKTV